MKTMSSLLQTIVGVVIVGALAIGLVAVFRGMNGMGQAGAAATAVSTSQPYPPPQATLPLSSPQPTLPLIGPSETIVHPTLTPWLTFTPIPSPTRRPGPTATPFPINPPASDASGTILYGLQDQPDIMALSVDGTGQKMAEATILVTLPDFIPSIIAPSPDGRYVLLLKPRERGGAPYIFDTQSKQIWPLFSGASFGNSVRFYGWHPDSHQVLLDSLDVALLLMNVETSESTVLTLADSGVQGATISPNGQQIVYIDRSLSSHETMWQVSAAGSDARPLFDLVGAAYVFGWSPNGANILYAGGPAYDPNATAASTIIPGGPMWLTDAEGKNYRPLFGPFLYGFGFKPSWSPDGQWINFTGQAEGQIFGCTQNTPPLDPKACLFEGTAIFIENIATGEIRQLATGIEPVWSPDGSMLAFLSTQSGAPEVWTIRVDGSGLQQLTTDGQSKNLQLSWSQ